jgi:1,4-dihydroxy-6-naphthoate synthase
VIPFDQIQQAVMDGVVDAGLLIHEGQLTYRSQGLQKIVDLGEWWFDRTSGLPLPLGGNVIRRDLGADMIRVVSKIPRQHRVRAPIVRQPCSTRSNSAGAWTRPRPTDSSACMWNELTLDYGPRGRAALELLW